jgi:hypothetical protein
MDEKQQELIALSLILLAAVGKAQNNLETAARMLAPGCAQRNHIDTALAEFDMARHTAHEIALVAQDGVE